MKNKKWIVAQIGSREKYAIPRMLNHLGELHSVLTDVWSPPHSLLSIFSKRVSGRFHADLQKVKVKSNLWLKLIRHKNELNGRTAFDNAFDKWASSNINDSATHVFAYSYSALSVFERAKHKGIRTILGQINPGPKEAEIVRNEFFQYFDGKHKPTIPEEAYWKTWRNEVKLADKIIVNSKWSKQALIDEGIEASKLEVMPLVYDRGQSNYPIKTYLKGETLKLLYLGAISIRKGFHHLKETMSLVQHLNVELHVVGRLNGPDCLLENLPKNIKYYGEVPPSEVDKFFRDAHLFMFPTLSDGFGLTQLEAQFFKLPIISSPFCAEVVTHSKNGMVVQEINPTALSEALFTVIDKPELIAKWSANSIDMGSFSVKELSAQLARI